LKQNETCAFIHSAILDTGPVMPTVRKSTGENPGTARLLEYTLGCSNRIKERHRRRRLNRENSVIILTADHGSPLTSKTKTANRGTHGTAETSDVTIPWIAWG